MRYLGTDRRIAFAVSWLALVLALTAACGGTSSSSDGEGSSAAASGSQEAGTPQRGGTLVVALSGDISGINELVANSSQITTEVINQMYLRLFEEQPDIQDAPPTFEPRLAKSKSWSEDHKVLTVTLRDDVQWSDGTPITAEDVRWTWQAQTHPAVSYDNVLMKSSIQDVEVVDPLTVRFHFSHVYPGQLVHANEGVILPRHVWGQLPFEEWRSNPQWFQDHLVVSGPFTLDRWEPQQRIVLTPNENYYEKDVPYLDRVVLEIVPDASSQLTRFLSSDIDFLRQLPSAMVEQVQEIPELEVQTFWPLQFTSVIWNCTNPLFDTAEERRAMALAMDLESLVGSVWHGFARPSPSPIVTGVWGHNQELELLPTDLEEARRLLRSQGWEDRNGDGILDLDGRPFRFDITINSGNQERMDAAVILQEQLARIGVDAQPRVLDWSTVEQRLVKSSFDAIIIGLGLETSLDVSAYFHSESIGNKLNYGRYSNPEVDRLLEQARTQGEMKDTKVYLDQLQVILQQDQPQTILWEPQRLVGVNRRIRDATPTSIATLDDLQYWWIGPNP
ncbi:MAG: ABC transporter substrate-binding protein [Acidobacteriota bacterium]